MCSSLDTPVALVEVVKNDHSSHSNAHVSSICACRRVVMFDTLIQQHHTHTGKAQVQEEAIAEEEAK